MKIAITILQLLCGLAIILIVLLQSGKSEGLSGAIGGVADSFSGQEQGKDHRCQAGSRYQVVWRSVPDSDADPADYWLIDLCGKHRVFAYPVLFYTGEQETGNFPKAVRKKMKPFG